MSDVVDLNAERNKREQPDPEFVRKDEYGRPLYCYTCSYSFDKRTYCTRLWAYSFEDAEAKAAAMRESLIVDGQLFSCVPA